MDPKTKLAIQRLADRYAPEWTWIEDRPPPQGERVLLYNVCQEWCVVGKRRGKTYWVEWEPRVELPKPTHWMPLPAGPLDAS